MSKLTRFLKAIDIRSGLAWYWSVASSVYLAVITFVDIPKENVRFADTILGFMLGTLLATILNWYFGAAKVPSPPKDEVPEAPIEGNYSEEYTPETFGGFTKE